MSRTDRRPYIPYELAIGLYFIPTRRLQTTKSSSTPLSNPRLTAITSGLVLCHSTLEGYFSSRREPFYWLTETQIAANPYCIARTVNETVKSWITLYMSGCVIYSRPRPCSLNTPHWEGTVQSCVHRQLGPNIGRRSMFGRKPAAAW